MSKGQKRIAFLLIGFLLIVGSFVWMIYSADNTSPIPAICFSAGFMIIIEIIKRALLDLSKVKMKDKR